MKSAPPCLHTEAARKETGESRKRNEGSVTEMTKLFKWLAIAWAIVAQNEALTLCVILFLFLAFIGMIIDAREAKKND